MRSQSLVMSAARLGCAIGAVLFLGTAACHKGEEAAAAAASSSGEAPIKAQTTAVGEQPMPRFLTLTGTLRANAESEVAADATGRVVQTFVERGQEVKRGQIIALLDSRTTALAATAAQAQAKVAQSQLEQSRRDCERVKQLLDTGAISQAEYDRQTSQCSAQQWSAAAAEAQGQSATKTAGDANIRAPFDGIVGERYVTVGQYVSPSTRVASVYDPDPLRLEVTVPEANVAAIKPDMTVTFTVVAFGGETFSGQVKFISPNVRESTRDLVVEAVVPNGDGRLKPGMFAVARVLVASPPTPVVPVAALVRDETGARAFVVVSGAAQERVVQTGETLGDTVAVLSGLRPGEKVVVKPPPDLHDGARVE
jgi:membrane fusion protein (multidrug efflux system)